MIGLGTNKMIATVKKGGGVPIIVLPEHTAGGKIWVSLDGGATWEGRISGFTIHTPRSVSIGGDINHIIAIGNSTNSNEKSIAFCKEGETTFSLKTAIAPSTTQFNHWMGTAASLDGTKYYATKMHTTDYVGYSLDGGLTWGNLYQVGDQPFGISCSSDGTYVFCGLAYTTNTYMNKWTAGITGTRFTITPHSTYNPSTACSGSGQYVYVTKGRSTSMQVARSSNYGASSGWTTSTLTTVTASYYVCIDCSESGQYVLTVHSTSNKVYLSTDYGSSWSAVLAGKTVYAVPSTSMISRSGQYMIVGSNLSGGNIYFWSDDFGSTWSTINTPTGFASGKYCIAPAVQESA